MNKRCANPDCDKWTRADSLFCCPACSIAQPGMDLSYTDFKNQLLSKPRWIARAIAVLTYNPHLFGIEPSEVQASSDLVSFSKIIQLNGGLDLPFTLESRDGKDAIKLVCRYAPRLYKYSRQKQQEKREREAAQK